MIRAVAENYWDPETRNGEIHRNALIMFCSEDSPELCEFVEDTHSSLVRARTHPVLVDTAEASSC